MQYKTSKDFGFYGKLWNDLDETGLVNSNYGERIFEDRDLLGQSRFDYALAQLVNNKESKNAVIMMRDKADRIATKDRCCTLALQFNIREDRMSLDVTMRSSDFWMGLPYDVFWYSFVLQRMIYAYNKATNSEIQLGNLNYNCNSLHVYSKHWDKIQNAIIPYRDVRDFYAWKGIMQELREHLKVHCTNYRAYIKWLKERAMRYFPDNDYEFPEWTEQCEERLADWLKWETHYRAQCNEDGYLCGDKFIAEELRNNKFPPFLETLGSFLVNKIKTRYATMDDIYYIERATINAGNSECIDRQVGCILVDYREEMYEGINTIINCNQQCDDKENRVCETVHAEINAINRWKERGNGSKLVKAYVTLYPCLPCMEALRLAEVEEIIVMGFSHKGATGTVTLLDNAFQPMEVKE
jgi:thymidylate synthase/deoxycytidylate deaminase